MKTPPKEIDSPQDGIHRNLKKIVEKHIAHSFQQPIRRHNAQIFESLSKIATSCSASKRILDSCCGTGLSSHQLAAQFTEHMVIGIDQSEARLEKQHNHRAADSATNLHFFRCNCEDIWRLCVEAGITFDTHTIFYPNPYPKSTQVKRRWHGHAVFPYLPQLARKTIVRSNWRLYLEEFAYAWELVSGLQSSIQEIQVQTPMTLFEKKYSESGQAVFELTLLSCENDLG